MGRSLAAGIPVKITVYKRGEEKINKEEQKEIKKQLERFYDLDNYEETLEEKQYGDFLIYKMNKKFFNDNIHKAISEIEYIQFCDDFLKDLSYIGEREVIDTDDKSFNQQNYPINLTGQDNICIKAKDDNLTHTDTYIGGEQYWLFSKWRLKSEYRISMAYVSLYRGTDKWGGTCETEVLRILNKLRIGYFKDNDNELAKTLTYYITG